MRSHLFLITALMAGIACSLAHADTIINFNALAGTNGSSFTAYTESGFTLTNTTRNGSNAMVTNVVSANFGTPAFINLEYDQATKRTSEVTLTYVLGTFTLQSFDVASDLTQYGGFAATGYDENGLQIFHMSQYLSGADDSFATYATSQSSPISKVIFTALPGSGSDPTASQSHQYYLDNLVLTPTSEIATTPEPSSIALLTTGLLSLTGVLRKRITMANQRHMPGRPASFSEGS